MTDNEAPRYTLAEIQERLLYTAKATADAAKQCELNGDEGEARVLYGYYRGYVSAAAIIGGMMRKDILGG